MSSRRGIGLIAATLALVALIAEPAAAAWLPPVAASGIESRVEDPQVAVDGAGNTTVVWTSGEAPNRGIRSAFRPAGGEWQPAVNRIGLTSSSDCHDPRLAVDANGDAAVVAECEKPAAAIRAAYRPGTSWSGGGKISGSDAGVAPRVGIADSGEAIVVWAGPGAIVQGSAHTLTGGAWGAAILISGVGETAEAPNVGVNAATGYAHAAWLKPRKETVSDPVVEVRGARRTSGSAGTWGSPFNITQPAFPTTPVVTEEPQIYVSTSGERLYGYQNESAGLLRLGSRRSFSDFGGYSEPPGVVNDPPGGVEEPRFALGGSNVGTAAWRTFPEGGGVLVRAAVTAGNGWTGVTTIGGPAGTSIGTEPVLAADAAGNATIAWSAGGGIESARRLASGGFEPKQTISSVAHPGFGSPVVTMTDAGDSLAVWSSNANHLALAVDDRTPPTLSPTVPASAQAGASVAMSATASDLWSGVSVKWDFGDGATGSGPSVSHAYATAGPKTVEITATDGAGNTTTTTRTIAVASSPSPPGGGPSPQRQVALKLKVPKQSWAAIQRTGAVKVKCKLDVAGSCAGKAKLKGKAASRRGSVKAVAKRFAVLKLKLTAKTLAAIGDAVAPVRLKLEITATATGRTAAKATGTLRIAP